MGFGSCVASSLLTAASLICRLTVSNVLRRSTCDAIVYVSCRCLLVCALDYAQWDLVTTLYVNCRQSSVSSTHWRRSTARSIVSNDSPRTLSAVHNCAASRFASTSKMLCFAVLCMWHWERFSVICTLLPKIIAYFMPIVWSFLCFQCIVAVGSVIVLYGLTVWTGDAADISSIVNVSETSDAYSL